MRLFEYLPDVQDSDYLVLARTDLKFQQGSSDKVYIAQIEYNQRTGIYRVIGYYARRGAKLTPDTKATAPTPAGLTSRYDTLVRTKMDKGYVSVHTETNPIPTKSQTGLSQSILNSVAALPSNYVAPPAMPPLQPMYNAGREQAKKLRTTLGMLKRFSDFTDLSPDKFGKRLSLRPDDYVLQIIPNTQLCFGVVDGEDFIIYAVDNPQVELDKFPHRSPLNNHYLEALSGLMFLGMRTPRNPRVKFAILDLITIPSVKEIYRKNWKQRRQIMNVSFEEMYPHSDPYQSFPLQFLDYYYETKVKAFAVQKGTFLHVDMNASLTMGSHNICTK
jgi:hypothetical protein